jgi:hypothetical protein
MIRVLLSWIVLSGTTVGIGWITVRALSRITKCIDEQHLDAFQLFWIGTAVTVAAANLVHFFFPLHSACLVVWLAAGMLGLAIYLKNHLSGLQHHSPALDFRICIRGLLFTSLLLLFLYLGASGVGHRNWSGAYDTDLYHFNVIRWLNEYPVIPGLGNLHSRLAHTSGFLTYSSLVDNLWWSGRTAWITYGLFVTIVCVQWLWIMIVDSAKRSRLVVIFCIVTFPYIMNLQTTIHPTLYFDNIALILQMVLMMELLAGFRSHAEGAIYDTNYTWTRITFLSTLAALGFSIKPIGAVSLLFVFLLACFVVGVILFKERVSLRGRFPAICAAGSIPAILIGGHILRNAIMAGWLLFPAPVGRLDVDWVMPTEPVGQTHWHEMQSVSGQYHVIKAWARLPGPEYHKAISEGFSYWFPRWKDRVWRGMEPRWLYIGSIMILLYLGRQMIWQRERGQFPYEISLIALSATCILYWFWTAPDMRFGRAFFWIWMGLGTSLLLEAMFRRHHIAIVTAILLSAYSAQAMSINVVPRKNPLMGRIGKSATRPVKQVVIENGQTPPLLVYVPISGDQSGDSLLPSTPYPLNTLRLRNPASMRSGFTTELTED